MLRCACVHARLDAGASSFPCMRAPCARARVYFARFWQLNRESAGGMCAGELLAYMRTWMHEFVCGYVCACSMVCCESVHALMGRPLIATPAAYQGSCGQSTSLRNNASR